MAGSHGHGGARPGHAQASAGPTTNPLPAEDPLSLKNGRWILPVVVLCLVLALLFTLFRGLGDVIPVKAKHASAAFARDVRVPGA